MPEVTEETIAALEEIAEEQEVPLTEVKEQYREKYEEVDSRVEGKDDDWIEQYSLRQFRNENQTENRVPTDQIEMLTVGGDVRNTSNGDMFFGSAVVDENPEDETSPAVLGSVRIFEEDLVQDIYKAFRQVGNVVTGNFSVQEGDIQNHVEVSDSEDTEFEVHQPDERGELVEEIRRKVPETSIATIADDISAQTRGEDGNMYTVSSDIRRIEADIYDGYKNTDTGTGIYTLRDETVFDEEDIADSPVFDGENANENATPGLTCFCDPNKMEWGSSSVVEFFGTVTKNEDGIINFGADGAVPILPSGDGFDGYEDSEDEAPSRDSSSSGNVDRTQI